MKYIYSLLLALSFTSLHAQETAFTRLDSLFGSITPERAWWDLTHYDLAVSVDPETHFILGTNTISYTVLQPNQVMQIELQKPMRLVSVTQNGEVLTYTNEDLIHFISLKAKQIPGAKNKITLTFEGIPVEAQRPPWDGGWTWKKDSSGKPFAANANQGIGASVWWPNKDHPYDEVDSLDLRATVPKGIMAVGNGRLVDSISNKKTTTYHWAVKNPINNYGVNINIGNYSHFSEVYAGEKGDLDLDFYVLKENLSKAKKQFKQVPDMLEAFEYWLGPYPFYEDSYKLVEVPYLGMEHQSSVTYGNKYANGYLGMDLSNSGWGLKFDYIIIHESAHEWFANNITNKDVADMWIQEGFTTYAESLYVDYHFGKDAATTYVAGMRKMIRNDRPIIGTYNVHKEGSGDMYFKGSNILHTLRQLIEDDEKWRQILRGLGSTFYHQTITSKQVEDYISEQSGIDLTEFWNQYLRTTKIPTLEFKIDGKILSFQYTNIIDKFDMPVVVIINGKNHWIYPTNEWKEDLFDEKIASCLIDPDFLVFSNEKTTN